MFKKNIYLLLPLALLLTACGPDSTTKTETPATQNSDNPNTISLTVDAGADKIVEVNNAVILKGVGKVNDNSSLSYLWQKGVEILATSAQFTYTPTVVGTDRLKLTVTHSSGTSVSDTVEIRVIDESSAHEIPTLSKATKERYLKVINEARASAHDCGDHGKFAATTALKWSDKLYKSSYEKTYDLTYNDANEFDHTGSGTETDWTGYALSKRSELQERIEHYGYNWRAIGENIGAGTVMDTPEKMVEGWLESPGHCANLMNPEFREVGMATIMDSSAYYTHYWTQNFGTAR